jgi:hypothetical protein
MKANFCGLFRVYKTRYFTINETALDPNICRKEMGAKNNRRELHLLAGFKEKLTSAWHPCKKLNDENNL